MHDQQAPHSKTLPLEDSEEDSEGHEENVNGHGCGCIHQLCFIPRQKDRDSRWILLHQQGEIKEGCLEKKAKKVREISELLAGPKWRNFIRRFSRCGINRKRRRPQFHYDPQSYVLNFDDGSDGPHAEFAARFGAPHRKTNECA